MISTKDIETVLVRDLSVVFPKERIFVTDDIPEGIVTEQRITVHVKQLSIETYFNNCFVEVNWCVPDIGGSPNFSFLNEAEHRLMVLEATGEYDDTTYSYELESMQILKSDLKCHYVNARYLFKILNVR